MVNSKDNKKTIMASEYEMIPSDLNMIIKLGKILVKDTHTAEWKQYEEWLAKGNKPTPVEPVLGPGPIGEVPYAEKKEVNDMSEMLDEVDERVAKLESRILNRLI